MPPKKATAQSKADVAKKQKQVEDKTFGLKNKNKSKQVQQKIQHLQQGVVTAKKHAGLNDPKDAQKKKKEDAAAREKELNDIFRVAISQPKVPLGVDPKSIVCEYFRRGQCAKGFKCKFSHDLNVERKGEKIDLYSDQRDGEEDTMEDWDQDKLEQVVATKGNEYKNENRATHIVCKHFLDAVERRQYGWFWACPNGGKECMYRHALPPGYVLKSQMKALLDEENANKVTIEEEIETQRQATKTSTPLTGDLFAEWKRKKAEAREAEMAAKRADRVKHDRMSGRELFTHDASLFVDDEDGFAEYERTEEEEESASQSRAQTADKSEQQRPPNDNRVEPSHVAEEEDEFQVEDDDDFDEDELEELEAQFAQSQMNDRPDGASSSSS